jgi:hypothetical protein
VSICSLYVFYKASTMFWPGFYKVFQCFYKDCTRLSIGFYKAFTRLLQGLHKLFTMCVTRFLRGVYKSACSVAATYKPPMLVPRVRLPAGAPHLISPWTAARNTVFRKAFTMFFTQLLQCLFTRLSQCFLRGFYKIVTMLYKAFTRL